MEGFHLSPTSTDINMFAKSPPWVVKVYILAVNLLHAMKRDVPVIYLLGVLMAIYVLTLSFLMPTVMFSVRDRSKSTQFVITSILMMLNVYILLCQQLKDRSMAPFANLFLQMTLNHFFHAQYQSVRDNHHVMFYSGTWSYLQVLLMILNPWILSQRSTAVEFDSANTTFLLFASVFAGEVLGCVVYIQYIFVRTVSDLYESLVQSPVLTF